MSEEMERPNNNPSESTEPRYARQHIRTYAEYSGWVNRPTWDAALIWSNDQDSYNWCVNLVKGKARVEAGMILKGAIIRAEQRYLNGYRRGQFEAVKLHLNDLVTYQVHMCEWYWIHNMLEGEPLKRDTHTAFDETALQILRSTDWRDIIKDCFYEIDGERKQNWIDGDSALRDWLADQASLLVKNGLRTSPLSFFVQQLVQEDWDATNWEDVASSFQEE